MAVRTLGALSADCGAPRPVDRGPSFDSILIGADEPPHGHLLGGPDAYGRRCPSGWQDSMPLLERHAGGRVHAPAVADAMEEAAAKSITEPQATVTVKESRSRKVVILARSPVPAWCPSTQA